MLIFNRPKNEPETSAASPLRRLPVGDGGSGASALQTQGVGTLSCAKKIIIVDVAFFQPIPSLNKPFFLSSVVHVVFFSASHYLPAPHAFFLLFLLCLKQLSDVVRQTTFTVMS